MAMAGLAMSAATALAGTKYQANLVNASATDPPTNPTMASGKLSLKDTGDIKAKVKGVTDGGGALVTGSTSFKDTGTLDGSEYVAILKMNFIALGVVVEVPVAMSMKNGGGKGAVALGSLVSMIPPGTGRSLEVTGGEVWGPLGGANVAACQAELATGFALLSSLCKGGTKVGVAGVDVP
jgi:hypothetical protein